MTRAAVAGLVLLAASAGPHPLGNFTVNRYAGIGGGPRAITVRYVVDVAEIPTFRELRLIDADGDEVIDAAERRAYLERRVPELAGNLTLAEIVARASEGVAIGDASVPSTDRSDAAAT